MLYRRSRAGRGFRVGVAATLLLLPAIEAAAGDWFVAPEFAFTMTDHDAFDGQDSSIGFGFGRLFGRDGSLGLDFSANRFRQKGTSRTFDQHNAMVLSQWNWLHEDWFHPYVSLGLGVWRVDNTEKGVKTMPAASAGVGYTLTLPWTRDFDLQNEFQGRYAYDKDQVTGDNQVLDSQALVRVRYHPGAAPPAAPAAPAPVIAQRAVTEKEQGLIETCQSVQRPGASNSRSCTVSYADRDGDGVADELDRCPSTIPNVRTDSDGCMIGTF
jgi:hypothetical protein